jgi:hypothetical protein
VQRTVWVCRQVWLCKWYRWLSRSFSMLVCMTICDWLNMGLSVCVCVCKSGCVPVCVHETEKGYVYTKQGEGGQWRQEQGMNKRMHLPSYHEFAETLRGTWLFLNVMKLSCEVLLCKTEGHKVSSR